MSIKSAVQSASEIMKKGQTSVRVEKADGGFITHTGKDGPGYIPDKKKVHSNLAGVIKHIKGCYGGAQSDMEEDKP